MGNIVLENVYIFTIFYNLLSLNIGLPSNYGHVAVQVNRNQITTVEAWSDL